MRFKHFHARALAAEKIRQGNALAKPALASRPIECSVSLSGLQRSATVLLDRSRDWDATRDGADAYIDLNRSLQWNANHGILWKLLSVVG